MIVPYSACKTSLYGMMSKNDVLHESLCFWIIQKNKKFSKAVVFPKTNEQQFLLENVKVIVEENPSLEKLSAHYLNEDNFLKLKEELKKSNIKFNKSKSTSVISKFDDEFFGLVGKKFKEARETKNKFNSLIEKKELSVVELKYFSNDILSELNSCIENWDQTSGKKYGWQRHSGYDRSYFANHVNMDNVNILLFFAKTDDKEKLIGYSVIDIANKTMLDNKNLYFYIIRKCDVSYSRNINLFIDYATMYRVWEINNKEEFLVHWGASGGGLLQYKRKFSTYHEEPTYFTSFNVRELKI